MPLSSQHRRWNDWSPRSVGILLAILIVLIFGAVAALSNAAWKGDTERASIEVGNLSTLMAQDIQRNIELYDLSIQGARNAVLRPEIMNAPRSLRDAVLFDRAAMAAYLGEITILDPEGNVLASSRQRPEQEINESDRDFFRVHALYPEFGLYVSRPLVSRVDAQQVIALSRRVTNPDGGFGGVVVGTLRLEYLHQLFKQMRLRTQGSLTLFRNDGSVMMREPFDPKVVGIRGVSPVLFDRVSRTPEGEYEATSQVDGIRRIFHYRRVGTLPLIVNAGLAVSEIHAEWWRRTALVGGLVALCCGAIILLTVRLGRELRRRVEAEAALLTLAETDGLTGLANRRRFDQAFAIAWAQAAYADHPLSLLMIDVDHFKAYNDRYGHAAGDEILRGIGRCLAAQPSPPGTVTARYGGEEFAVILPGLDAEAALAAAERIRLAVQDLAIGHDGSRYGRLTVSIGCATADPAGSTTCDRLANAADAALYRSKRSGRNLASCLDVTFADLPLPLAS